jgi:toxin FitB
MIILDTNVISELVKLAAQADRKVLQWAASQPLGSLSTTTISLGENLAGIRINAEGADIARKQLLFEQIMAKLCDGRIYPFDTMAARAYAELLRERRTLGRPISRLDAQIAAIARSRQLPIATRDADFLHCGIELINPWETQPR